MYCTCTLFEATSVNHMHTLHDCCFVTKCAKTNRPFYLIICLISLCNYMVRLEFYNVHSYNGVLPYGYKFLKVIKFHGFRGHQPNCEKNPGKIFVGLHPCKNTRVSLRMALLCYFHPITEEKLFVLFSFAITCSLIHEYHRTTNPEKGMVITPNKSAEIKTFENLIIKMFQQKHETLTPQNLYPYGILLVVCWCSKHISQVLFLIQLTVPL